MNATSLIGARTACPPAIAPSLNSESISATQNRTFPDETPPAPAKRPLTIKNLQSLSPNDRPVLVSANNDSSHRNADHRQRTDDAHLLLKASMTIASMDFFTVLSRFDVTTLTRRLHQKPELYFHLINSYANLMRANLEREKFDFNQKQAEARQRERQQKLRACKPILLTGATLHNLSRALSSSRQREEAESSPQLLSAPAPGIRLSRSVTSTGNTGVSDIREFAPRTPNYEPQPPEPLLDQSDHIWTDEPADDLVCCPS